MTPLISKLNHSLNNLDVAKFQFKVTPTQEEQLKQEPRKPSDLLKNCCYHIDKWVLVRYARTSGSTELSQGSCQQIEEGKHSLIIWTVKGDCFLGLRGSFAYWIHEERVHREVKGQSNICRRSLEISFQIHGEQKICCCTTAESTHLTRCKPVCNTLDSPSCSIHPAVLIQCPAAFSLFKNLKKDLRGRECSVDDGLKPAVASFFELQRKNFFQWYTTAWETLK